MKASPDGVYSEYLCAFDFLCSCRRMRFGRKIDKIYEKMKKILSPNSAFW